MWKRLLCKKITGIMMNGKFDELKMTNLKYLD